MDEQKETTKYYEVWGMDKFDGDIYLCGRYKDRIVAEIQKKECEDTVESTQEKDFRDDFWIEEHTLAEIMRRESAESERMRECERFWKVNDNNLKSLAEQIGEKIMETIEEENTTDANIRTHRFSVKNPLNECYTTLTAIYNKKRKVLKFEIVIPDHIICRCGSIFDRMGLPRVDRLVALQMDFYYDVIRKAKNKDMR